MLRNTAAQSQRLWNKGYKEANFHSIPPHSTDVPWRQFSKSRPQARLWISFFLRRNTFAYPVIFTKHPYSYYRRKPFAYPFSPASRTPSEPPRLIPSSSPLIALYLPCVALRSGYSCLTFSPVQDINAPSISACHLP